MVDSFFDIMSEVRSQWHSGCILWYHVRGQKSMTWWPLVGSLPDIMSEVRSQWHGGFILWYHVMRSEVNDMVGSFCDIMSEVRSQWHGGLWWVHYLISCQRSEVNDMVGSFCDIMSWGQKSMTWWVHSVISCQRSEANDMVASFCNISCQKSKVNDMVGSFCDIMSEVSSQWHGGFIPWYHVRGQKSMTWTLIEKASFFIYSYFTISLTLILFRPFGLLALKDFPIFWFWVYLMIMKVILKVSSISMFLPHDILEVL